jgi:uncharacterized membrane protein
LPKTNFNSILLIAIIALAAILRFTNIGSYGLGGDEKYSLMVVNGISWEGATQPNVFGRNEKGLLIKKYFTPKQFWDDLTISDIDEALIRTDNGNSSTYYALLYVWKSLFGQADGTLRVLGVFFDLLSILLVFLFCKNILNSNNTGLIAALFIAIEPFLIAYSHQIRNYPVGTFLTLLAAYLFFKILKNESQKQISLPMYFAYGLVVLMGVLCHFYIALFLFCHFLVLIICYLRNFQLLKRFIVTYIIAFSFVGLWFTIGSARDTFETLKSKDIIFANIVKNPPKPNTFAGWVEAPTYENFKSKIGPIIADNYLITNDIFQHLNGKLNLIFCVLLAFCFCFLLYLSQIKSGNKWLYSGISLLLVAIFYFIFTNNQLYYIYLSLVFVTVIVLISQSVLSGSVQQKQFVLLAILSLIVPIAISILGAYRAGHTANIYQKYVSYGLPIAAIIMAFGINSLKTLKTPIAYMILIIIGIYVGSIYKTIGLVLGEKIGKYTIFNSPRIKNPYIFVAKQIENTYQPGDTIIYPSNIAHTFAGYDPQMDGNKISVIDAQLTNIYLPKKAEYIQRVDAAEQNKLFIYRKKENKRELIFDFEGNKFRY